MGNGTTSLNVGRRPFARWDRPTIRKQLGELGRRGEALNSRAIRRTHPRLFGAAIHWFGSYRAAIEAAKLDYAEIRVQDPHRWSRKAIVREIRQLQREHVPLHHAAVGRQMPELVTASYRYFGTYRRAVEAAGIKYTDVRVRPQKIWNKRRIISELKRLKRDRRGLWARSVRLTHPYLPRVAREAFGSYRSAARAAGIDAAATWPPPYRRWSAQNVIDELKRLGARNAKALAPTAMREKKSYLVRVAARRFGSYRKAVEAAGFDYLTIGRVHARPMAAHEVIAQLQALQERGKDLRYSVVDRARPRLLNAARRRFGSYEKAMQTAGIAYPPLPPLRHWTEKRVLNTLLDLHENGEDLRHRAVKKHRLPLYEAARYYFGTYVNAVRVAGIRYDPMVAAQRKADRRRKLAAHRAARAAAK
jgi:hypothetical protein